MFVKISAKPVEIVLVQVYEEISEILHQEGRGQVNAIVMGDFNSIMGKDLQISC